MRNPWLDIPLADYESHMSLAGIGQAQLLADQLDALVRELEPASVAVIGCAGGNGFDQLERAGVARIVGVDINADYIAATARRCANRFPGLELYVADIQTHAVFFEPVDFIYAALVFEYVDPARAMASLRRHCRPGGTVATIVQLPHESVASVTSSPFASLGVLSPVMKLVHPEALAAHAEQAGFRHECTTVITSTGGKQFAVQNFS